MASTFPDAQPRATAVQLRAVREKLLEVAGRHGLTQLRIAEDGTLLLHVEDQPGYQAVLRFISELTPILGAEPHVVTDDSAIAPKVTATPV